MPDARAPEQLRYYNPFGLFHGIWVPDWLLAYGGISDSAKLLFARLARYAGKRGIAFPSQERLALDLRKSPRRIRELLLELKTDGLIDVQQRGTASTGEGKRGRPAVYRFVYREWIPMDGKIAWRFSAGQSGIARRDSAGQSGPPNNVARARPEESHKPKRVSGGRPPRGAAAPRSPISRSERNTEPPPDKRGRGYERAKALVDNLTRGLTLNDGGS